GGKFEFGEARAATARPLTLVTLWSAEWRALNSLSGGSAAANFKGFASSFSPSTPACGGTWTAKPGNSGHPPKGPLPSFLGVVVSSSVSKKGSTISGNIVQIVVVKTSPGYSPNPGHVGKGTIVATLC